MKSDMVIKVEFLAGTTIKNAILEAKQKAELWRVAYVEFTFNGTNFAIDANADVESVLAGWGSPQVKP